VGRSEDLEDKTRERGTLGEIAKMAGVGHTTTEQYDAIQRKGTEEGVVCGKVQRTTLRFSFIITHK